MTDGIAPTNTHTNTDKKNTDAAQPCNRWEETIFIIITIVLGIIAVTTIFGALWLSAHGISPIPESVIALGSTATGALAGVLVPRPSTSSTSKQG
jgi:flagellar basal body-associated protein FliL